MKSSSYLGNRSGSGGRHLRTLQRRGRARFGTEGCHTLADTVRQYKLLPQLDIRSSLGYSVLRARIWGEKGVFGDAGYERKVPERDFIQKIVRRERGGERVRNG